MCFTNENRCTQRGEKKLKKENRLKIENAISCCANNCIFLCTMHILGDQKNKYLFLIKLYHIPKGAHIL